MSLDFPQCERPKVFEYELCMTVITEERIIMKMNMNRENKRESKTSGTFTLYILECLFFIFILFIMWTFLNK